MNNIVGGDSVRTETRIGLTDYNYAIYAYGFKYDKNKNGEYGGGIGGQIFSNDILDTQFQLRLGGSAGLAIQEISGKRFIAETNSNPATVVFGGLKSGSYPAVHIEDAYAVEFNLELGAMYRISKSFDFTSSYTYQNRNYQYGYKLDAAQIPTWIKGAIQDSHYFSVGLNYRF